ncbi:MAG: hypothetical protein Q8907_16355 [Bacteroidota bacterium]|nr:hypothetical protein [Bacteroidota bacterium]MDP4275841.1 hypothetical protein [Bacteroidota bacterium]
MNNPRNISFAAQKPLNNMTGRYNHLNTQGKTSETMGKTIQTTAKHHRLQAKPFRIK